MNTSDQTIEITICSGTLCHIMGGTELWEIENKLSELSNCQVNLTASNCLGVCQGDNRKKPPCIKINTQLIEEATIEKIILYLKK